MEQQVKIKVVDAIMGTGKSTWAINFMKEKQDERFIYVTPFLDEVTRLKNSIPSFCEPRKVQGSKLVHFKDLLKYGKNIATTHQLMDNFDLDTQQDIELGGYTLILDEVADVVSSYNKMTASDRKDFLKRWVTTDENGYLVWNEENQSSETYEYGSKYYKEMILCLNKNLILVDGKIMYWELPINTFKCFKEVYILTYLFHGSMQKAYFDLFDINYDYLSVKDGKLVPFEETPYEVRQEIKSLIKLVDKEKLNLTGKSKNAYGATWLKKHVEKGTVMQDRIKLDTENFFKNIAGTLSEENMWTTLGGADKDEPKYDSEYEEESEEIQSGNSKKKNTPSIKSLLRGKAYGKDSVHFVSFNIRATNNYQHKRALAYLFNVYPHYNLTRYFNSKGKSKGVKIDEEAYALSTLIQWIWRSSIRRQDLAKQDREIHLYLPSRRMREILLKWLDSKD